MNSSSNQTSPDNHSEHSIRGDDEISLVDVIISFGDFLRRRRTAALALLSLGVIGGLLAGFLFNPTVVQLSIRNVGQYFELNNFKSMQTVLVTLSEQLVKIENDQEATDRLIKKLQTPGFVEKSIIPEFSVSKADLKSSTLPDKASELIAQNSEFLYMRIELQGNREDVIREDKLLAELCVKLYLREQFFDVINIAINSEKAKLSSLMMSLSKLRLDFERLDRELSIVRKVRDEVAPGDRNQTMAQFSISNMVGNGADQVKFLPLDTQVRGLEIDYNLTREKIDQTSFQLSVSQFFLERLYDALQLVLHDKVVIEFPEQLVSTSFWTPQKNQIMSTEGLSSARQKYLDELVSTIIVDLRLSKQKYDLVKSNGYLISERKSYSKTAALMFGLLAGIMAIIFYFGIESVVNTVKSRQKN